MVVDKSNDRAQVNDRNAEQVVSVVVGGRLRRATNQNALLSFCPLSEPTPQTPSSCPLMRGMKGATRGESLAKSIDRSEIHLLL
jgi:hypothetical protein